MRAVSESFDPAWDYILSNTDEVTFDVKVDVSVQEYDRDVTSRI